VHDNRGFWTILTLSVFSACLSVLAPTHTMPLDYSAITSRSLPLAVIWAALLLRLVLPRVHGQEVEIAPHPLTTLIPSLPPTPSPS
jgi:hypothetical protein